MILWELVVVEVRTITCDVQQYSVISMIVDSIHHTGYYGGGGGGGGSRYGAIYGGGGENDIPYTVVISFLVLCQHHLHA